MRWSFTVISGLNEANVNAKKARTQGVKTSLLILYGEGSWLLYLLLTIEDGEIFEFCMLNLSLSRALSLNPALLYCGHMFPTLGLLSPIVKGTSGTNECASMCMCVHACAGVM